MDKILKNSAYLLSAQVLTKGIGFFYTFFLASHLGVDNFGLYVAALAYYGIISTFADFGFNRYVIREGAKDSTHLSSLISSALLIRIIICAILVSGFVTGFYLFDKDPARVNIFFLGALATIPQALSLTFDAILIAREKIRLSSLGLIFLSLFTAVFGVLFVSGNLSTKGALFGLILGQIGYVVVLFIILRIQKIGILSKVNKGDLKRVFLGSLPYGLLGSVGLVSYRVDTLFLSYIRGSFETGIYGAAYKFLDAITFVPVVLATVLFPVLVKLYEVDVQKIKEIYFKSMKLMFVLGAGVTIAYILILPSVIKLFLPNYLPSVEVIKILALAVPFIFMHIPSNQVLLSTDRFIKPLIKIYFSFLTINLILNFIFISLWGYIAAAWLTVFSEIMTFSVFFFFLNRRVFK